MKIAILTPTFLPFSGIDRLAEIQAKEFAKKGHKVTIYALKAGMNVRGVRVVEIGMPKSGMAERLYRLFMFFDSKKINRYAREISTMDLVVSHLYPMNLIAKRAKQMNPKLVYRYSNAGVGITDAYSFAEKMYLKIFNFLNNKSINNCDEAVSISRFLSLELEAETGIKSSVKYIPIDKKRFHPGVSGTRIRKKYGLGKNKVFLYVGRISPHKGVHHLLDAFALLQKKNPNSKLIIAGKPTFPAYFKKLRESAGKDVIFAGFVPDSELSEYYAACDVYATGSLWEGFDMPVAEANAMGKSAVVFDVGSHPEVLKKGLLVPAGNILQFAQALEKAAR